MRKTLLKICRDFDVSAEAMWPVVSDLDGYADHVTGLSSTPVLSGSGATAVRQCNTTKDQTWSEEVSHWVEGESYAIEVDTSTYPFPLKQLFRRFTGIWTITETADGCNVCIEFLPDVRGGYVTWPLVKLGARQSIKDLHYTLDSYGKAAADTATS